MYDPVYAIVALASRAADVTAPIDAERARTGGHRALFFLFRGLRMYPQIMSLYVGFENGDFLMVTQLTGEDAQMRRAALGAPAEAVFASEMIVMDPGGQRRTRWFFLTDDGAVISNREEATSTYDPRPRPWYVRAKKTPDAVEDSGLYVFASTGEPGFTLSWQFGTPVRGVFGADLSAREITRFLQDQRITRSSTTFIFNKAGELVAVPDPARMAAFAKSVGPDGSHHLAEDPRNGRSDCRRGFCPIQKPWYGHLRSGWATIYRPGRCSSGPRCRPGPGRRDGPAQRDCGADR